MIAAGCLGFFFMTEAVRLGDISVVIPFRYTRLAPMAAGILILGEQVNAMMLLAALNDFIGSLHLA